MRALEPEVQGYVEQNGVKIGYEVFSADKGDSGAATVVFVPIDLIAHGRAWKAQVPYLARTCQVVTIDSPGNGRSDRTTDPTAYDQLQMVADTIAVLDARRGRARGARRHLLQRLGGAARRGAAPRPGARRRSHWSLGAQRRAARAQGGSHRPVRRGAARRRGLGEAQPALLAARLAGLRGLLLRRDLLRAALDQADRGHGRVRVRVLRRAADRIGRRCAVPRGPRRGRGTDADDHLPGARRARHRGPVHAARPRRADRRADGCAVGQARRVRPSPAGPRPGARQPAAEGARRLGVRAATARRAALDPGDGPASPGALPVVADRARSRAPRPGDRAGAARAAAGRRGRLANPGAGGRLPAGAGRAGAPGVGAPGQRERSHREPGRRARPARLPGDPHDGRGAGRELHGVPRPGHRGAPRPVGG